MTVEESTVVLEWCLRYVCACGAVKKFRALEWAALMVATELLIGQPPTHALRSEAIKSKYHNTICLNVRLVAKP